MNLNRDLKSPALIHAKGFLFLVLGLLGAGALYAPSQNFRTLFLLAITVWGFCRFYYYLFYVLERYLGREKKYAGVWDALRFLLRSPGRANPAGAGGGIRLFDSGKDHAAVVSLWTSVLNYAAAHNAPEVSIRNKVEAADGLFFVAESAGRLVGTVMAGYDGHRGWIYSLAIDPAFRNRGIGRSLLGRAESALRERGCVKINLQIADGNEGVAGFYEKMGYAVEPRTCMGKITLK